MKSVTFDNKSNFNFHILSGLHAQGLDLGAALVPGRTGLLDKQEGGGSRGGSVSG